VKREPAKNTQEKHGFPGFPKFFMFKSLKFGTVQAPPANRDGESFFQLTSLGIAVVMVRVASWHHALCVVEVNDI